MNYLVMECHPGYAVVLSDDGRFLKVANMRYEVGQTVTNVMEMCLPQSQEVPVKTNNRRWISTLAAMAACLVLVFSGLFWQNMPYASVYLTINPEVRIDVNRSDVVVGVEGMNADGMDLLEGYDHRKKDLDTVMDELVDLAIDMGYLHEGGKITLSLDADEDWIVSHGEHLNQHLNEHLTDKITVTIDVEQKQPTEAAPTAPAGTIVIPVGPEHYGESDYGEDTDDDGDSCYASDHDGDSAYDDSDDGQTDYDDVSDDDGQSEYDDTADDGQSEYTDTTDDGQSSYAEDGQSGYDTSDDTDDGQSDYESSDDERQPDDEDYAYEESDDDDD
ncbi:MAG: hypothetical protein IJZ39_09000 [Oscillospiraceae bacterium]|nr:hypothetical protein [Oscillospiraceae bacterium]